jgi:RNA polymerase sigma-70 factor (ECF subfamily)
MGEHCSMLTAAASDSQIVAACRAGDRDAWQRLVERFDRYVLGIIRHGYRVPPQDAEDVFQEVFIKAYARLGDLRNDDAIGPWLAGITRRTCLTRLRTRVDEPVDSLDEETADEAALEQVERAMDVDAALRRLPEACQEILERFFRDDQPYAQIAAELGLPAGTIASRISRCLSKLKVELEGRQEPVSASGHTR